MKLFTSLHLSVALLALCFLPAATLFGQEALSGRSARLGRVDTRGWRITTDATPLPGSVPQAEPSPLMKALVAPGDENWADLFGLADLDGDIFAMAPDAAGGFYAGGSFRRSGKLTLNAIARWSGTSWLSLGSGVNSGVDGIIYAIAVSGSDIYVGGKFTKAGGIAANNIAKWNTTTGNWSALGSGIGGDATIYVSSIAVNAGNVYVGGWFSTAGGVAANNIARWSTTGSSWSALGSGPANGIDGDVLSLAVKDSLLYVGGSFNRAGGVEANNIVRWNLTSQTWRQLIDSAGGNGLEGYVNTMAVGHGMVYIGGSFLKSFPNPTNGAYGGTSKPGGDTAINAVRWTGTRWLAMTNLFDRGPGGDGRFLYGKLGPDAVVRAISINGDSVYVGGTFLNAQPASYTSNRIGTSFIARWDGATRNNISWTSLGAGTNGYVNAIASVGSNVFVGGSFRSAGNLRLSRIARWNIPTNSWSGLRTGPSGSLYAIALHGPDVWAAGLMATPSGASGYRLARWNGTQWVTLNSVTNGPIYAIAISGDDIYVGGLFSRAGTTSAVNIARYNITSDTWFSLGGSGVGGIGVTYVDALAVRGSDLYVGGDFQIADDVAAANIARWNGTGWSAVGSGVNGVVVAIGLGSSGELYVGGDFSAAGSVPAREIARWNGTQWSALGSGVHDIVRAITVSGSSVYVGGDFTAAGSVASRGIARWDGTQWFSLSGGVSGGLFPAINAIATSGSSIYAGGGFDLAGGVPAPNIARWDGGSWHPLGSGTDDQVRALLISGSDLYAAGDFNEAGAKASYKFGQWTAVPNRIEPGEGGSGAGGALALRYVWPNPVVRVAKLGITAASAEGEPVRVAVYDRLGREVAVLADGVLAGGASEVEWDASGVSAGVYYCRLEMAGRVESLPILVNH
jgi:hypothetical protein